MKKLLFFSILNLGLLTFNGFAQQNKIDSILTLLKTDKADTSKVIHLNTISVEYKDIDSYDSAMRYANAALAICKELLKKNTDQKSRQSAQKSEASSYNTIGNVYSDQGNYPKALKNYFESLRIREVLDDKKGVADSYNNIGIVYDMKGEYPEALKNYFSSLKIRESIGDKEGIASSYCNIGLIYTNQGNYTEALKNFIASSKIREVIGDKKSIADSYNNLGMIYNCQGNYSASLKNHKASLKIRETIGDKEGIADSYTNIGIIYSYRNKYPEVLKNFFASLKIYETLSNKTGIASSYNNIGEVFMKQKKYKEAAEYLTKGKELAKKIGHKEYLKEAYSYLTDLDSAKGNFKGAYENHKNYILYRDSIDNEETRKKTIQSQMIYDFEKKEAAIKAGQDKKDAVVAADKKRQQLFLWFLSALVLAIAIIAVVIFRGLQQSKRAKKVIEIQRDEISQQKEIVEQQKQLVEEHQKEIVDSITYAKRLQQAILPSADEIKKYLPNSFIYYQPKDIVAGDFYWMEHLDETTYLAAADSTGHGVPGAMVSVVCSNALNRAVKEFALRDTGKILDKTRELVLETFEKSGEEIKDGMDISLLSFNKNKQQAFWSGANNQLWYIKNHGTEMLEIKADKQPIGKTENPKPFTTHSLELQKGDTLYLMTDGYPDQFGGDKGKKYKYKQLEMLLIATSNKELDGQKEMLSKSFENWKGNLEQVDDVTIIGIRIGDSIEIE